MKKIKAIKKKIQKKKIGPTHFNAKSYYKYLFYLFILFIYFNIYFFYYYKKYFLFHECFFLKLSGSMNHFPYFNKHSI